MNAETKLKMTTEGPIARVTLNRPDIHNAFDDDVVEALTRAAGELAEDDRIRVVVLAGEGNSF